MRSEVCLTIGLVVALFSNATLLLVLILQVGHPEIFKCRLSEVFAQNPARLFRNSHEPVNPELMNSPKISPQAESGRVASISRVVPSDDIKDDGYFIQDGDVLSRVRLSELKLPYEDWVALAKRGKIITRTHTESTTSQTSSGIVDAANLTDLTMTDSSGAESPNHIDHTSRDLLSAKRQKREADVPTNTSSGAADRKPSSHRMHEIFSTFTDQELARFDPAVYDLLVPALLHFETMVIRELDSLHTLVISFDFRLENLENSMLNIARGNGMEPQADTVDNKSEPDSPSHILARKEGLLAVPNNSQIFEIQHLEVDGSGDGDLTPTTPPAQETTPSIVAFYDMYRILSAVEQKVMALENYNVMSDSELTRVRSEVVKMDDKVTELDRRQRNLQIRTSMHTQKITELEVYMSKSEMGIHTALESYSRVNSRLEAFKDKLTEFKNDLQAVTGQFGRHDQVMGELRTADSYKAHDIQEMRKSVFSIESRLNGLYRVLDLNLDTVRTDLRAMLDRLCANNKLAC